MNAYHETSARVTRKILDSFAGLRFEKVRSGIEFALDSPSDWSRFSFVRAPIIILGSDPVRLGEEALVEGENATIGDLERLLAEKPRAAVITSGGEPGFFRASLCLERGVSRIVLRRGVFEEAWEGELAARARTFGAEVYTHDDARGYGRVKPGMRVSIGAPRMQTGEAWASDISEEWAERAKKAEPLEMDPDIEGLPSNLEETAFAIGDKPVLYLVVPSRDIAELQKKYAGKALVFREIPLTIEAGTGRRVYASSSGENNAHVFIANDASLAQRAAALWDEGSSRNAVAMGELLGYPPCCVAAFVALEERGNNAALTYVTATRSRALGADFCYALNSAVRHVIPCTPCSFGCSRAMTLAERTIAALPEPTALALKKALGRPVLYFDEARAIVFENAQVDGQTITYERARFLPAAAPLGPEEELATRRLFGALFADPGKLFVRDDVFEVHTNSDVRRLARTPSRLGILLPFGRV